MIVLWPDYFFVGVIKYLDNLFAMYAVVFIFNNRKKVSGFSICALVYFAYILLDTFLQGGGNIHTLVSNTKILLFIMSADIQIEKDDYEAINIMWLLVFAFSTINFVSLLLFPDGLYQVETVWNEWGTKTSSPYWVFGYKNSHAFWYLLLEVLSALKWYLKPTKNNRLLAYIGTIMAVWVQLLVDSSTAIVASIVGAIGIFGFISLRNKNDEIKTVNSNLIIGVNYIANILLISGMTTFLGPIIQTLFHKDLTFSNRTNAWIAAFANFLKSPIFGTGILTSDTAKEILGSLSYMQAHNELLQCLWQGGIILFVIVTWMFLIIAKQTNEITSSKLRMLSNIFMITIFIEMMFEAWLGSQLIWIMMLLIYKFNKIEKLENRFC